eukprot:1954616-Ditylum_brightwellii.AAC.1
MIRNEEGEMTNDTVVLKQMKDKLDETWKDEDAADFWTFKDVLSCQIMSNNPLQCKYLGDVHMKKSAQ